jgi:hypothetical protein
VAYQPDNPQKAQIVSFAQLWLGPVVVVAGGLLFFLMGIGSFFLIGSSDRHQESAQDLIRRQFLTRTDAVLSEQLESGVAGSHSRQEKIGKSQKRR